MPWEVSRGVGRRVGPKGGNEQGAQPCRHTTTLPPHLNDKGHKKVELVTLCANVS